MAGMHGTTLLIVDDHAAFRAVARDMLHGRGFDVVGEAGDGDEAISKAASLRPEVVLVDVRLPGIDGFEVARQLRAFPSPPDVVLVSTTDASDLGRRLGASGAHGFITKSRLSGDTLRELLRGNEEDRA
jgi:DNA-binding NarL/FixJ family response regulator